MDHPIAVFPLLGLLALTTGALAAPIASEHFDYAPGAIGGCKGGAGFWEAFVGKGQVAAGTLDYTDAGGLRLASGGNQLIAGTDGAAIWRSLDNQHCPPGMLDARGKFGADGSTVYIAFLARLHSGVVTAFGDYGGISFFDNGKEELFIGDPGFGGEHTFWGVDPEEGSRRVQDSKILVDATVHLLVTRIDFAPNHATLRFYIDPPLNAEPAEPVVGPITIHSFWFDRLRIQAGGHGEYEFDENFLGTTYADVTPSKPPAP